MRRWARAGSTPARNRGRGRGTTDRRWHWHKAPWPLSRPLLPYCIDDLLDPGRHRSKTNPAECQDYREVLLHMEFGGIDDSRQGLQ